MMEVRMCYRAATLIGFSALLPVASPAFAAPAPAKELHATLTALAEVPGPGKKGATGTAVVTLFPPRRVCYVVKVRKLANANAAHIHEGAVGKSGPPVITLNKPDTQFEGCTVASHGLMYRLANSPKKFYVNVHSQDFPNGAIRGQLHR
jgi:hypothetical protein